MTSVLTRRLAVSVLRTITRNRSVSNRSNLNSTFTPAAGITTFGRHGLTRFTRVICQCTDCPNSTGRSKIVTASTTTTDVDPAAITDVAISDVMDSVLYNTMVIVDVREPTELLETGTIGHAINIPVGDIEQAFSLTDTEFNARFHIEKPSLQSDNIVMFCKSGKRAMQACQVLHGLGYTRVKRYPGGMMEWEQVLLGSNTADRRNGNKQG